MKHWTVLDFEASSTNKLSCRIAGVGISTFDIETGKMRESQYIPTERIGRSEIRGPVTMFNADYDLHLCRRVGIEITSEVHDVYLMAKHYRTDFPSYSLKSLSWYFFGDVYLPLLELRQWLRAHAESDDEDTMDLTKAPPHLVAAYCKHDLMNTARLAAWFWPYVQANWAYKLDNGCVPLSMEMEKEGIVADLDYFKRLSRLGKRRMRYNRRKARERMNLDEGVNPMGKALREHLADLGEDRETPTHQVKADDSVLRDWKDEDNAIAAVRRVRKDQVLVQTFAKNILAASNPMGDGHLGVFHANFMQSAAVTRRFRCSGLYNQKGVQTKGQVQNFPDEVREGITVPPNYDFYKMDLASIEARVFSSFMELLMNEGAFAHEYRLDPFFNVYLHVIEKCTGEGKVTKKHELYTPYKHGTLGRLYGSSAKRFSKQLRDDFELDYTRADCEEIYRNIDRRFPFIRRFQRLMCGIVEEKGVVLGPFGEVYHVPRSEAYMAVAYTCQGSATMVLRWWWLHLWERMKDTLDYIFCTVHDEFDLAAHKAGGKRAQRKRVQGYADVLDRLDLFGLPIKAEVSGPVRNWREAG